VFLHNLLVFARLLRRSGIEVHPARLIDAAEALQHVDLGSRDDVYHACRALFVHRREQLAAFDRVFEAFWGRGARMELPAKAGPEPPAETGYAVDGESRFHLQADDTAGDAARLHPEGDRDIGMWSAGGGFADKDFAAFTAGELRLAHDALERLEWTPGVRRTRRWTPGRGSPLDIRRAMALSRRTGGDVVALPRRIRRERPRPLVLICDVSGSMERYSRVLLHFAHALAARQRGLEAFVFSTTLTRVTRELHTRRIDAALAAVGHAVPDWSGGTRIGDALRRFHQQWARRVMHHGPVVLLVSDGWDRGDPELLRGEVARLQRGSHRLIWLNPLIGTADYAPLTRGLKAALPYVHDFLPVRTMTDMAELAAHLNALAAPRRA
jgi:uncharacterized protein with von Willebrand factor type A (vWA) domain